MKSPIIWSAHLLFYFPSLLLGQVFPWQTSGPSISQKILDWSIDPQANTLYAVAAGPNELFISLNGGNAWQLVSGPSAHKGAFFGAVAVDPHQVNSAYVSLGQEVYKISDGGTTWEPLNTELTDDAIIRVLLADPLRAGVVYAGHDLGLLMSENGGSQWIDLSASLPEERVLTVAIDPHNPRVLYGALGNCSCNSLLFKSDNGGATWTEATVGLPIGEIIIMDVAINSLNTDIVYAATNLGLFKSMDAGGRWSLLSLADGSITNVTVDPTDDGILFAASSPKSRLGAGVFRSADGGENWTRLHSGHPSKLFLGTDSLYAGLWIGPEESGIYRLPLESVRTAIGQSTWGMVKNTVWK